MPGGGRTSTYGLKFPAAGWSHGVGVVGVQIPADLSGRNGVWRGGLSRFFFCVLAVLFWSPWNNTLQI